MNVLRSCPRAFVLNPINDYSVVQLKIVFVVCWLGLYLICSTYLYIESLCKRTAACVTNNIGYKTDWTIERSLQPEKQTITISGSRDLYLPWTNVRYSDVKVTGSGSLYMNDVKSYASAGASVRQRKHRKFLCGKIRRANGAGKRLHTRLRTQRRSKVDRISAWLGRH